MRKLKATTLVELLITLLIIPLTIALVYMAYSTVQQLFRSYYVEKSILLSNKELVYFLEHDFNRSDKLLLTPENQLLAIISSDTVVYTFTSTETNRLAGETSFSYKTSLDSLSTKTIQSGLIAELSFLTSSNKNCRYQFIKQYSTQQLLAHETH